MLWYSDINHRKRTFRDLVYYLDIFMKTLLGEKAVFLVIGGVTVSVLILIAFFSVSESKQSKGNAITYSVSDRERPKAQISSLFADLGNMKVKDEKTADFIIENVGTKPLRLSKISSSCDCTFGKITIDGKTSPEFGMHSKNNWVGTVDPSKKATLSVIYRPYIMPVKGVVTRDVYVGTNDPLNERLTFSVKAIVD